MKIRDIYYSCKDKGYVVIYTTMTGELTPYAGITIERHNEVYEYGAAIVDRLEDVDVVCDEMHKQNKVIQGMVYSCQHKGHVIIWRRRKPAMEGWKEIL